MRQPNVVLVSMPWTILNAPSLGLGILKAQLEAEGIPCRVRHANIFLLQYLRSSTYNALANSFALNDFLFTRVFEEEPSPAQLRLVRERAEDLHERGLLPHCQDADAIVDVLLRIRNTIIPQWMTECLEFIVKQAPTFVGFSCMFDQTIASVALSQLVRRALPDALIALGGYALEGATGQQVLRSFPWIDAISLGDGENKIGALARASVDQRKLAGIAGVLHRMNDPLPLLSTTASQDAFPKPDLKSLDESPIPNYDDFFHDLAELKRDHKVTIQLGALPVEASRGCWWGQRHHCIFCGIDDETMKYRTKSPARVLHTLACLRERYGVSRFRFADYILPYQYYKDFLPLAASVPERYTLACELKANLNGERFRLLQEAGFTEVQPGIESFSTPVLRRMDKGVSAIQNIQTLLLGQGNGITVHYNILFDFPGDKSEEYERMLQVVPLLYHLDPPTTRSEVQVTRFAPLHSSPHRFGLPKPVHDPRYQIIFSHTYAERIHFNYDDYAYYFDRAFYNSIQLQRLYILLCLQLDHWRQLKAQREVRLTFELVRDGISFFDSRYAAEGKVIRFGKLHARVFEACALEARTVNDVLNEIAPEFNAASAVCALDELIEERLVLKEDEKVLGLALPLSSAARPSPEIEGHLCALVS